MSGQAKIRIVRVSAEEISRAKSSASSARSTLEKPVKRRLGTANRKKTSDNDNPKTDRKSATQNKVRRRKTTAETNRPPNTIPMWKVLIGGKVQLMDSANRVFTFNVENPVELGMQNLTTKTLVYNPGCVEFEKTGEFVRA